MRLSRIGGGEGRVALYMGHRVENPCLSQVSLTSGMVVGIFLRYRVFVPRAVDLYCGYCGCCGYYIFVRVAFLNL